MFANAYFPIYVNTVGTLSGPVRLAHPEKALEPMLITLLPSDKEVSAVLANALSPTDVTVAGTCSKPLREEEANAPVLIDVRLPKLTEDRAVPANALAPTEVKLAGRLMDPLRLSQEENAPDPIETMPLPNESEIICVLAKAFDPIDVTELGILSTIPSLLGENDWVPIDSNPLLKKITDVMPVLENA